VALTAPQPLSALHQLNDFDCGVQSLNDWLSNRALKNQTTGASRTFVVCENKQVIAFYALASSAIANHEVSAKFRRNMPNPIPVITLARLAVSQAYKGQSIARAMLKDVGLRVVDASNTIGIRGIIVHALSEQAKQFYLKIGFRVSPIKPMTLMITVKDLELSLSV